MASSKQTGMAGQYVDSDDSDFALSEVMDTMGSSSQDNVLKAGDNIQEIFRWPSKILDKNSIETLKPTENKRKYSDNKVQKEEDPESRPPKSQKHDDDLVEELENSALKYKRISQCFIHLQRTAQQVRIHCETLNRLAASSQCTTADLDAIEKAIKYPCNYVVCGDTPFENVQIGGGSSNCQSQKVRQRKGNYLRKRAIKILNRARKTLVTSRNGGKKRT
ncbi:uncharacterized protein LOC121926187 isoform X2 [Sceloporus undulatus]|uniref:uncharacterized protein LOC121926187 isoform X2 n=1 Tax=Sceloporus undulatus TaxID=8520 RepID=UPI001C4BFC7A|nr:uncharacterized protein LOC121926187 isoform X2 [Sceloporus undulatus]